MKWMQWVIVGSVAAHVALIFLRGWILEQAKRQVGKVDDEVKELRAEWEAYREKQEKELHEAIHNLKAPWTLKKVK